MDYCARHGIVVQAYASLGTGSLLSDPEIMAVGRRTGLSEAAVLLLWAVGHGFAVIPRSTDPSRIAANRAAVEQARQAPVGRQSCRASAQHYLVLDSLLTFVVSGAPACGCSAVVGR